MYTQKILNITEKERLMKAQNNKIANVASPNALSLFMDLLAPV